MSVSSWQKSEASIAIRIDTIKNTQRDTDYDVSSLERWMLLLLSDAYSLSQFQSAHYESDKCPMEEV